MVRVSSWSGNSGASTRAQETRVSQVHSLVNSGTRPVQESVHLHVSVRKATLGNSLVVSDLIPVLKWPKRWSNNQCHTETWKADVIAFGITDEAHSAPVGSEHCPAGRLPHHLPHQKGVKERHHPRTDRNLHFKKNGTRIFEKNDLGKA